MKKLKVIVPIVISIIIVIGIFTAVYFISGQYYISNSLSSEGFIKEMKKRDFKTTNTIKKHSKEKDIVKAYKATEKDNKYELEFLEFSSTKTATSYFNKEREDLTTKRDEDSVFNYFVIDNKERYTLNEKDHYILIERINNTIVKFNVESKYSEEIITLLEELGY